MGTVEGCGGYSRKGAMGTVEGALGTADGLDGGTQVQ